MIKTSALAICSGWCCMLLLTFSQCTTQPSNTAADYPEIPMNDSIWQALHAELVASNTILDTAFLNGNYELIRQWSLRWQPLVSAMAKYREDSDVHFMVLTLPGTLGNMQSLTGDPDNGLKNLLHGQAAIEREYGPKSMLLLDGCIGIGSSYSLQGDYENAIYWQYKGIEYAQRIYPPGHSGFGKWHFNIGYYRSRQGDYAAALAAYEKAAEIYAGSGYKRPLAYTYERAADAARHLQQYAKARHLLTLGDSVVAYSTYRPENDKAILALGKAAIAMDENHPDSALIYLKASEKHLVHVPVNKSPAWSDYFTLKGDLSLKTGALDTAINCYQKAITGNYQHVVQCFMAASQSAGFVLNQELLNKIAGLYLQKGDIQNALNTLQDLLNKANAGKTAYSPTQNPSLDELPHSVVLISTLHLKAKALEAQYRLSGRPEDLLPVLATYRLGTAFVAKLNRGLRWENSKFTLEARAVPLYESAIAFLLQLEQKEKSGRYALEAWELADRCKAVTLQEQLALLNENPSSAQDNGFGQREKKLRESVSFLEQQLMAAKSEPDKKDAANRLLDYQNRLLEAKYRYAALMDSAQILNLSFYQQRSAIPVATYPELRTSVLKKDAALVEYFVGDSALYVFGLDASGVRYHIERLDTLLQKQIRQVSAVATDFNQPFADFTHDACMLYTRLLSPVLPGKNPPNKIVVIPDGLLCRLPFHLLLDQNPDPGTMAAQDWRHLPYLLKSTDFRYEYAASLLLERPWTGNRAGKPQSALYAGFAPTYHNGRMAPLKGVDSLVFRRALPAWRGGDNPPELSFNCPEVDAAATALQGVAFLAGQATERQFKESASKFSILHLAMHALVDDEDPLYSQLIFSPNAPGDTTEDGRLHAYELYHLQLHAALAVLSACQTGAGKTQKGEGILSLSRAFKYAGCPNIVMSLWNADDASCKRIMEQFFNNLKQGAPKDRALANAQRHFLDQATKEEGHPAHWATFVLIGDDLPVVPERGWLVWVLTAIFGAGILYFFFFRPKAPEH